MTAARHPRRHRRALLAALALAAAPGCDGPAPAPEATEGPVATDHCSAPEQVPVQGEGHLVGDQPPPVPYNSTPPTSGWHTSAEVPIVISPPDDPLSEPEQVTVLEQGGVVITHDGLDGDEYERLERLVADSYAGEVALTPYGELGQGEIALTAWGVLQRCDAVDVEAIEAFVDAHAARAVSWISASGRG